MHQIFLNIKSFFKNEKIIFFIMIICVISSAFIINFSYGLYYNYNTQKSEFELELKEVNPEIAENVVITKGELKKYVESLSDDSLNSMIVIYFASYIDEFKKEDNYGPLNMRFVIHDRKYGICEVTKKSYETHGLMTSGRYITNDEETNGSNVAIVCGVDNDNWDSGCLNIKNNDGTITLFEKKYQVIGTYNAGSGTPIIPFLSIPDDLLVHQIGFSFERNVTRSIYNNLIECAEEQIPGILIFPELQFPDNDEIDIYNNMISISLLISILSVINFAMLYQFIIKKRQRNLSIMRMCGCTKIRAIFIYLGECIILTLPCYLIGILINIVLTNKIFNDIFEFFIEAYSINTYIRLFLLYFVVFIIILIFMIINTISKTIVEEWKE